MRTFHGIVEKFSLNAGFPAFDQIGKTFHNTVTLSLKRPLPEEEELDELFAGTSEGEAGKETKNTRFCNNKVVISDEAKPFTHLKVMAVVVQLLFVTQDLLKHSPYSAVCPGQDIQSTRERRQRRNLQLRTSV